VEATTSRRATWAASPAAPACTSSCQEPPNRLHAAQNASSLSSPGTPVSATAIVGRKVAGGVVGGSMFETRVGDVSGAPMVGWLGDVTDGLVGSLASSSSPEQAPPSTTNAVNAIDAIATEPRTAIWAIVACDLRC
jgi:hypothetical protein